SNLNATAPVMDGTDPPHAVDTAGKPIPGQSATQPDKPIILAKDIDDPKWGETKPDAAFDHVKHSTDANYSATGKAAPSGVDCHNDAKKRDAKLKAPVTCEDCHTKKG